MKTPTDQAREQVRVWLTMYATTYPQLRQVPSADLLALVGNKRLGWAERGVALGNLAVAAVQPILFIATLESLVKDETEEDYLRVDAALALALVGRKDPQAVAILRRVLAPKSYFAITQSNMERGAACLGLALFGDIASRPQIVEVSHTPINGIDRAAALALQVLSSQR